VRLSCYNRAQPIILPNRRQQGAFHIFASDPGRPLSRHINDGEDYIGGFERKDIQDLLGNKSDPVPSA
jgi:hypothetical protein